MVTDAQIVLTDFGELGWGITSPQLPALVGGTIAEPTDPAELYEIARFGGLADDGTLELHMQRPVVLDGVVYMVRVRQDHRSEERGTVADRAVAHLRSDSKLRDFTDPDPMGDRLIVAALPEDRLSDVTIAVEAGSPVTIAVRDADGTAFLGILSRPNPAGLSLADLGLTTSPSIGDLAAALAGRHAKVLLPV